MSPSELATQVVAVLVPYLAQGAVEFARVAGEVALNQARGLLARLKERWADDPEATDELQRFEQKPERYQTVLTELLEERLADDPELAKLLSEALTKMGPSIRIVQEMDEAKRVVALQAKRMKSGHLDVEQEIGKGEDITGADIDEIG